MKGDKSSVFDWLFFLFFILPVFWILLCGGIIFFLMKKKFYKKLPMFNKKDSEHENEEAEGQNKQQSTADNE